MKYSIKGPVRASVTRRLATVGAAAAMVVGLSLTVVGPASASPSSKGLATATARLKVYLAPAKWQGPNTPLHTTGLSGDKVVYISANEGIPVLHYWSTTIKGLLAKYAGVDMQIVDANSNIATAQAGFQQAIATGAKVVAIIALPLSLFATQIAAAHAAGIKVIAVNNGVPGNVTGGADASATFDYVKVGQLVADWFISNSKGLGKGTLVTSSDVPASPAQAGGTTREVKALCPKCSLKVADVQIAQWASGIPTLFQSIINTDPKRTYIMPVYDGQSLPGLTAIRTLGAGKKVNVASFNATDGIVQLLKDPKSGLKFDIGGDNTWDSYAIADQILRVLDGMTPVVNYHIGLRVFDAANATKLIVGTNQDKWFGYTGYQAKFKALWQK
jgi:ribose transport system substrate-binding protein